jgi:twinkle protein
MASTSFLKPSHTFTLVPLLTPLHQNQFFHINILPFSSIPASRVCPLAVRNSGFSYTPNGSARRIVSEVDLENLEDKMLDSAELTALNRRLQDLGFDIVSCKPGNYFNLLCPMCKGGESKEKKLNLRVAQDGASAKWTCFRPGCMWKDDTRSIADGKPISGIMHQARKSNPEEEITEKSLGLQPLCSQIVKYFSARMISEDTLQRNSVMQRTYRGDEVIIAFTYRRDGKLMNCKYRDAHKKFWQEKGSVKIFYGLDDIKGATDIIIVEGEMDKLSLEEAGFRNCISVPDGAPAVVSTKDLPPVHEDIKYQYIWNCKEYLEQATRIILATDGDGPGQALAEELARRLGRERCWRVKWPKKNEKEAFKDANEVLAYLGPDVLREAIQNAEEYPIKGLFNFRDYFNEIDDYYNQTLGYELGISTGWTGLNQFYNVVPGELTIVTGVPNSGKSEWIDALLCNLNKKVGWKFALCSMENKVPEHARKLLEKHIGKPFFNAKYGESLDRICIEELKLGQQWLNDTFSLIRCENDSLPSIDWVLGLARIAVLRHGVNGLVIDPYNELNHQRPSNQTETEYVSQMLTKVKKFAQHNSCHVWFVAHPRQLHQWVGTPPNLYDISGSAHFINKCDNGIVIHRNRDPETGPIDLVQVCVRKVRNKVVGTIGDAYLTYNRATGQYSDLNDATKAEVAKTLKKKRSY